MVKVQDRTKMRGNKEGRKGGLDGWRQCRMTETKEVSRVDIREISGNLEILQNLSDG